MNWRVITAVMLTLGLGWLAYVTSTSESVSPWGKVTEPAVSLAAIAAAWVWALWPRNS